MFLVDKYTPQNVKDVAFHKSLMKILINISKDDSIPHIILYGPEGCGKKTLINLFLERVYSKRVHKLVDTVYTVKSSGNSETEVTIKQSDHHIVIDPNNNNFDRYLIQDVVKEYAKRMSLGVFTSDKVFKTVLINSVDKLPYYAQTSLRRTLEKFSGTCRFVMWCRSLSKVIEPLRSRCLCIRIPLPTEMELFQRLYHISVSENINLNIEEYKNIIVKSKSNVKTALWMLESHKYNLDINTSFNVAIEKIIVMLLQCNIENINYIRDLIYQILITNYAGTYIIQEIVTKVCNLKPISDKSKYMIIKAGADYEHNLIRGRRDIIHLEAFIHSITKIFIENDIKAITKHLSIE